MADLGETVIISLPTFIGLGDITTSEQPNAHPSITIMDPAELFQAMEPVGYYIAGTVSFYTGPPVPREGQIWPRGNITNDK